MKTTVMKATVARPTAEPLASRARWRVSQQVVLDLRAIADLAAIAVALSVTVFLFGGLGSPSAPFNGRDLEIGLIVMAVAHSALRDAGAYRTVPFCTASIHPGRFALVLSAVFGGAGIVAVGAQVCSPASLKWFGIWLMFSLASAAFGKLAAGALLRQAAQSGSVTNNVAVYGAGFIAQQIATQLQTAGAKINFIGIFDDRKTDRLGCAGEVDVAGDLQSLIEAGRADLLDEIIIALPNSADGRIAEIAGRLEHLPVRLSICTHLASDLIDIGNRWHSTRSLGLVGLLDVQTKPLNDWAPLKKRILDIGLSSLALTIFSPIFLLIAIAIKLDSPGPILFRQSRHGLNHRVFRVLKFRTMTVSEDGTDVLQAKRGDPRVTVVGSILRRTSLDELPQLVNILLGEMSLVGPRPHAVAHNQHYGEIVERYANRHRVKPGLTGWAQVNGLRGETTAPEAMTARVAHDLHYINNWSLLFDVRILAKTLTCGFFHTNAY